jgi:hypothetical protein
MDGNGMIFGTCYQRYSLETLWCVVVIGRERVARTLLVQTLEY